MNFESTWAARWQPTIAILKDKNLPPINKFPEQTFIFLVDELVGQRFNDKPSIEFPTWESLREADVVHGNFEKSFRGTKGWISFENFPLLDHGLEPVHNYFQIVPVQVGDGYAVDIRPIGYDLRIFSHHSGIFNDTWSGGTLLGTYIRMCLKALSIGLPLYLDGALKRIANGDFTVLVPASEILPSMVPDVENYALTQLSKSILRQSRRL